MSTSAVSQSKEERVSASRSLPDREALARLAIELEGQGPLAVLEWIVKTYRRRVTLASSFGGPTGMVLLDMLMRIDKRVPVHYLDTDLLFPETYALVETVSRRYSITPIAVRSDLSVGSQAARYGEALWARDPDRCCELRKVIPQRASLARYRAWITGLRRDQGATRRATPIAQWDDTFGLAKFSPLATWTEREVWQYISDHDVPVNQLHARGYPSVGCTHCTRALTADDDDVRAGRWSGFAKTECGLHRPTVNR